MIKELWEMLVAAEQNLIRYKDMGNERAIRAGELMVAELRKLIEENA